MSKKLCVYTCITGNYDNLHEIKNPEKDIDYLCFTNNKNLKSNTWKIIHINNEGLDNHYLSRKIKMLGHPIISKNYDVSVWMDASIIWQKPVTEFVKKYLKNTPFAAFKHSQRNTVNAEAIACLQFRKDSKEIILQTIDYFKKQKFPDNLGLYEMTVFIKKHNDPQVINAMETWFNTIQKYSKRDQLSFMYAIWKTNLKVSTIDLNIWHNPWFYAEKHNSIIPITNCHIYYGDPDVNFDFNKYYIYQYNKHNNTYKINTTIPNDTNIIEINLANTVGLICKNIVFKPSYNHIMYFGSIEYNNKISFCIGRSTIKFFGNFKKGQKLSFSIDMQTMNTSELQELAENLWLQNDKLNNQNYTFQSSNTSLQQTNNELQNHLHNIENSKSYKLIRKLHHVTNLFHHTNR